MSEPEIIAFLRCPAAPLIDLALEMANLTWKENLAITQCGRLAKTQERAAEDTGWSVDAMQKWYRSGIKKLLQSWSGIWWIQKVIK